LPPATAVTVRTYAGTTADVVADGVPEVVSCKGSWKSAAAIWDRLDPSLRVGLFVVPLDPPTFAAAVVR
jgi:hypothetical protein